MFTVPATASSRIDLGFATVQGRRYQWRKFRLSFGWGGGGLGVGVGIGSIEIHI